MMYIVFNVVLPVCAARDAEIVTLNCHKIILLSLEVNFEII